MRILLAQWHSWERFGSHGTERIEIVWMVPSSCFDESHRKRFRRSLSAKQSHTSSCWYNCMQRRKKMLFFSNLWIKSAEKQSMKFFVYFLTLVLHRPLKLSYRDILIKAEKLYWCYCVAGYYCQCCRKLSVFLQFFTAETNQGQCLNCFTWKYCVTL